MQLFLVLLPDCLKLVFPDGVLTRPQYPRTAAGSLDVASCCAQHRDHVTLEHCCFASPIGWESGALGGLASLFVCCYC